MQLIRPKGYLLFEKSPLTIMFELVVLLSRIEEETGPLPIGTVFDEDAIFVILVPRLLLTVVVVAGFTVKEEEDICGDDDEYD